MNDAKPRPTEIICDGCGHIEPPHHDGWACEVCGEGLRLDVEEIESVHRLTEAELFHARKRLPDLRDELEGERDNEKVRNAERNLREAIRRQLRWCPSLDIARQVVEDELVRWQKEQRAAP